MDIRDRLDLKQLRWQLSPQWNTYPAPGAWPLGPPLGTEREGSRGGRGGKALPTARGQLARVSDRTAVLQSECLGPKPAPVA